MPCLPSLATPHSHSSAATFLRSSPVLQAVLGRGERPLGLLHGVLQLPDLLLQTGGLLLVVVQLLNVSNVNMLLTTRTRDDKFALLWGEANVTLM